MSGGQDARSTMATRWRALQKSVCECTHCERLVEYTREVAATKRKAYQAHEYWGRPVPDFGRPNSDLLVVGLAPGAHGANRTGRLFTGDRSGDWLYRALHRAGFANQAQSTHAKDGLKLSNCTVTNICRCAPPNNRPNREELTNCRPFLLATIELVRPTVLLALGAMAWQALLSLESEIDWLQVPRPKPKFSHGSCVQLSVADNKKNQPRWLLGSYHPSQQNTFTGRLTEPMLDHIFVQISELLKQ